ncbi:hypothetical protein DPX16_5871 [Anabarilius grahami]|uniref:Uncharacterized protein n=1 Tax=Anabarilius grahami TaxID=495550 RepID=A0A3N0Y2V3_ANAGA|nr:hypothetical protein DPX16_5871 [Anabarilius grahami]
MSAVRVSQCESDQVCEPAPPCIAVGYLVKFEGVEEDPAYNPDAEGELRLDSMEYNYLDMDVLLNLPSPLVLPTTKPVLLPSTKSVSSSLIPPSLPLPSPLPDSASLSASPPLLHPVKWIPASEPISPCLGSSLPPSAPPDTIVLTAERGSLIPPATPWSDITLPAPRTYGTLDFSFVLPPLRLQWALPSFCLRLGSQSHWLCFIWHPRTLVTVAPP